MESEAPYSCYADPNFAVIAAFLDKFGKMCGIPLPAVSDLVSLLECKDKLPHDLSLLHTQLLRRVFRTVSVDRWEKAAVKFCQRYSLADAANIEQHGYLNCDTDLKLRFLMHLLEAQFDCNAKFKGAVNLLTAEELRPKPIGKDEAGKVYWVQLDSNAQLRIYREDPSNIEEGLTLIAQDRASLVKLLHELTGDDSLDFSSTVDIGPEVKDTPVLDTGQNSEEESGDEEEGVAELSDGAAEIDDDEEDETAKTEQIKDSEEMATECSAAIEEPVMVIEGQGNGAECEAGRPVSFKSICNPFYEKTVSLESSYSNLICSEPIEEPIMYFYGLGSGKDCEIGNPERETANNSDVVTSAEQNSDAVVSIDKTVLSENIEKVAGKKDLLVDCPKGGEDLLTENNVENKDLQTKVDAESSNEVTIADGSGDDSKPKVWSINDICRSQSDDVSSKPEETQNKSFSSFSIANVLDKKDTFNENKLEDKVEMKLDRSCKNKDDNDEAKSELIPSNALPTSTVIVKEVITSDKSISNKISDTSLINCNENEICEEEKDNSSAESYCAELKSTSVKPPKIPVINPSEKQSSLIVPDIIITPNTPTNVEQVLSPEEVSIKVELSSEGIASSKKETQVEQMPCHDNLIDKTEVEEKIAVPKVIEPSCSTDEVKETDQDQEKTTDCSTNVVKSEESVDCSLKECSSKNNEIEHTSEENNCSENNDTSPPCNDAKEKSFAISQSVGKDVDEFKTISVKCTQNEYDIKDSSNKQNNASEITKNEEIITKIDTENDVPNVSSQCDVSEGSQKDVNASKNIENACSSAGEAESIISHIAITESRTKLDDSPKPTENETTTKTSSDETCDSSNANEDISGNNVHSKVSTKELTVKTEMKDKTDSSKKPAKRRTELEALAADAMLNSSGGIKSDIVGVEKIHDEKQDLASESNIPERKSLRNRRSEPVLEKKAVPPKAATKKEKATTTKKTENDAKGNKKGQLSVIITKKGTKEPHKKVPSTTVKKKGKTKTLEIETITVSMEQEPIIPEGSSPPSPEDRLTEVDPLKICQDVTEEIKDNKKKSSKSKSKSKKTSKKKVDNSSTPKKNDENKETPKKQHYQITGNSSISREMKLLGVPLDAVVADDSGDKSIRTSRRIAQIKIKEAEERRQQEEDHLAVFKKSEKKEDKAEEHSSKKKKKKKSKKKDVDEDYCDEDDAKESKSKKKKKGKSSGKSPWLHSSDTSSHEEDFEDYEIEEEPQEEENIFKSDHEFSPESDLDEDPEYQPTQTARTARVTSAAGEDKYADTSCEACKETERPDFILLCDTCDKGWHTDCLSPVLHIVPEGQWFCPPCSHTALIAQLKLTLREYDRLEKQRENEELRKKRLAFVGISLDNVLPSKKKKEPAKKSDGSSESESSSEYSSSSSSYESDEPVYQLRERRSQVTSYRYNEYDEMIRSAIQDDMPVGTSKPIREVEDYESTDNDDDDKKKIDTPNTKANEELVSGEVMNGEENNVPTALKEKDGGNEGESDKEDYAGETEDDEELADEVPPVVPRKRKESSKKKKKKLTNLDFTSEEEDRNSDSDFKGASDISESDDATGSASSEEWGGGKRKRGPVRRSTRARQRRYDKDFVNDDTSDDEDEAPKKRKRRDICSDESSDSDQSWGGRGGRKKRSRKIRLPTPPRWSKKKKKSKRSKRSDGSDNERPKKRKIKYGMESSDEDVIIQRKTRGKKISYLEDNDDDSDDEVTKKQKKEEGSDGEFVLDKKDDDEYVQDEDSEDSDDDEPIIIKSKKATSPKGKSGSKRNVIRDSDSEPDIEDLDDEEEEKLMEMLEKGDVPVEQLKAAVKRAKEEMKHKADKPEQKEKEKEVEQVVAIEEKPKRKNVKITPTRAELEAAKLKLEKERALKEQEKLVQTEDEEQDEDDTDNVEEIGQEEVEDEEEEEEDEEEGEDDDDDEEEEDKRVHIKENKDEQAGGLLLRSLQGLSPNKANSTSQPVSLNKPVELPVPVSDAVVSSSSSDSTPSKLSLESSTSNEISAHVPPQPTTPPRMLFPQGPRGAIRAAFQGTLSPQQMHMQQSPPRQHLQGIPVIGPYPRPGIEGFQGPHPGLQPRNLTPAQQTQGVPGTHPPGFRPQGIPGPHSQISHGIMSQNQHNQGPIPMAVRGPLLNVRPQVPPGSLPPGLRMQGPPGHHINAQLHQQSQLPAASGHPQVPLGPGQSSGLQNIQGPRPPLHQMQGPPLMGPMKPPGQMPQPSQQSTQGQIAHPPPTDPHSQGPPASLPQSSQSNLETPPKHAPLYPMPPQQNIHSPYSDPSFSPEPVKQRKKPGPKPGSKNRKKTEEELQALAAAKGKPRGKRADDVTIATVQAPTQFPDAVVAEGGSVITKMLNSPQGARPLQESPNTRFPGASMFHTARPMDPSPSGGGAVSVAKSPFNQETFPQYQNFQHYGSFPPEQSQNFQPPPFSDQPNFPPSQHPQQPAPPSQQPGVAAQSSRDEEGGGEFGGLASYFASQAEEDMDT